MEVRQIRGCSPLWRANTGRPVSGQHLIYNLLLLFWVSTIPFTTSALADYIKDGSTADVRVAVLLYGVSNEGMAIAFLLIVRHMLYKPLVAGPIAPDARRRGVIRFGLGSLLYPVVTVVGLFSVLGMYALYLATIVYYIADRPSCSRPVGPASTWSISTRTRPARADQLTLRRVLRR